MAEDLASLPESGARATTLLDRLEGWYLGAIRVFALGVATLLIVLAAWLALSGSWKATRDASSVTEAKAAVSVDDLTKDDATSEERSDVPKAADTVRERKTYYENFLRRYHALFQQRFEVFDQPGDEKSSKQAFDARFVHVAQRVAGTVDGSLNAEQDRSDLDGLLQTMTQAAVIPKTVSRLTRYRQARKVSVSRTITGTRSERYCSYYGYYINECITYGTREVPYSRTVKGLKLPAGVVSPFDLFASYHDRYVTLLDQRRQQNAAAAAADRDRIIAGNGTGINDLWLAAEVLVGFVVLMFLFLLVALERHQRRIARSITEAVPVDA